MKYVLLAALCCMPSINAIHKYREDSILKLVKKFIPKNPIIVEAGAHHGEDTARMAKRWPDGHIHAFEPLPPSFDLVIKATRSFNNVFGYRYALSDMVGSRVFYAYQVNDGGSSLLPPPSPETYERYREYKIDVKCITLDEWAQKNHIDHIDFMWLDMEGHELAMLMASPHMLKTIKAIYTEVNLTSMRKGTPLYKDVKQFLKDHGFSEIFFNYGSKQGNALFVRI